MHPKFNTLQLHMFLVSVGRWPAVLVFLTDGGVHSASLALGMSDS